MRKTPTELLSDRKRERRRQIAGNDRFRAAHVATGTSLSQQTWDRKNYHFEREYCVLSGSLYGSYRENKVTAETPLAT